MELNDAFGADKFGSAGWEMDVGRRNQTPVGGKSQREIQGQINGCSGVDCNPKSSSAGWRCRMQRGTGMLEGCVALAGHSTALLTFSSVFGVERIPNVPVWDSRGVQHLPWDLLLLLMGISQWNTWSGVIVLQEEVGLVEVCGVFQGLAASD